MGVVFSTGPPLLDYNEQARDVLFLFHTERIPADSAIFASLFLERLKRESHACFWFRKLDGNAPNAPKRPPRPESAARRS